MSVPIAIAQPIRPGRRAGRQDGGTLGLNNLHREKTFLSLRNKGKMKGSDTKRGMLLPTRKGLAVEHRTNKACNQDRNEWLALRLPYKQCSKCGEIKQLGEFRKRAGAPDGHEGKCKACAAEIKRAWADDHRELLQEANRESRAKARRTWNQASTIVCSRCGQEKSKDQYYPGKWICKECNRVWRVGQWKHEIELREEWRRGKGMKAQTILPWCSTCPSCSVPHRFKTPEQCATWQWRRFLKSIATRGWIEAYEAGKKEMNRVRSVLWYRARYATQPEIERERVRQYKYANPDKVQQWGDLRWQRIANSTDGTINKTELSVILNEHKTCPYCGKKLMESNKVLDHMEPVARGGTHSVSNLVVCCSACNMRKNAMPWAQWVEHLPPKYQARAERIWERRKCYQLSLMNIQ